MAKRIRMLENPSNLGYGGSIKRGFRHLEVIAPYIAVMHSDAQCAAAETILDMVEAFGRVPEPDVVLASRFVTGADTSDYNLVRRWANLFFNAFTRIVCGVSMSDAGTGIMSPAPTRSSACRWSVSPAAISSIRSSTCCSTAIPA